MSLDVVLPQLRADFRMGQVSVSWRDGAYVSAIVTPGSTGDDRVSRATLEPWRERTTGRFELMMVPGDHLYLRSHRSMLLEFLTAQLVLLR